MTVLLVILLAVSLVGMHIFRGGTMNWSALPCYGTLATAAALSFFAQKHLSLSRTFRAGFATSCAFFGYVLLRTVLSPADYLARPDLYMVTGGSLVYLLVALHLSSPGARAALVTALLVLAVASCVVGAIQFTKANEFMPFEALPRSNYGTRISGFLGSPNHLAGFLEVIALLGISITFWSRFRIWVKILFGYASLVCLAGIALTGSRGGYLSIMFGLLVFAVLSLLIVARQKSDRLGYVLTALGLATFVLGMVAYVSLSQMQDFRSRLATATTVDDARMRIWPAAVKQFHLSPVFGTGSGTFVYYGREFRDRLIQTDPKYAHNDYLQFLAEYGITGLAAFLVFLVFHLRNGWKALTRSLEFHNEFEGVGDTSLGLTIGALSAVAAFIVHSAVDFNLHVPGNTLLLAFVFGILANPGGTLPPGRSESEVLVPLPARLVLPALGLWLFLAGLPKLPGEYLGWKAREALGEWTTLDTGEYAVRAEDFARRGLHYDSKNTDLLNYLGDALFLRGDLSRDAAERERLFQESVEVFQRAVKLAPQDRILLLSLGWSLDALKRFEESDRVFERAVALDPNSSHVRWAQASHLHLRGKLVEAEAEYKKSLAIWGSENAQRGLERVTEELKAKPSGPEEPAN